MSREGITFAEQFQLESEDRQARLRHNAWACGLCTLAGVVSIVAAVAWLGVA